MLRVKQRGSKGGRDSMQTRKVATAQPGHSGDAVGTWGPCADKQGRWLRSEQEACVEDTEADSMPLAHREKVTGPCGSSITDTGQSVG